MLIRHTEKCDTDAWRNQLLLLSTHEQENRYSPNFQPNSEILNWKCIYIYVYRSQLIINSSNFDSIFHKNLSTFTNVISKISQYYYISFLFTTDSLKRYIQCNVNILKGKIYLLKIDYLCSNKSVHLFQSKHSLMG